ncbi:MAG: hypothetical protein HY721_20020 [Planctomycetes bacterium]|nr:hypothetical protein [Planctomycetota bacterium]
MDLRSAAPGAIPDATAAYRLWDEIFGFCLNLALSTSSDSPEEKKAAWERLIRGHQRSLRERDAMWVRLIARTRDSRDAS